MKRSTVLLSTVAAVSLGVVLLAGCTASEDGAGTGTGTCHRSMPPRPPSLLHPRTFRTWS